MSFSQMWYEGIVAFLTDKYTIENTAAGIALTLFAVLLCIVLSYLLGSINLAIIVSGKFYGEDIRNHGSGNAGMTNVMRTYGKKMAVITFIGDFLKAVVASIIGRILFGYIGAYVAGLFCFIGHIFPCFYKFKGGKGVVTACAMVLMTDWRAFLILIAIFILIVCVTKYISLGAVIALMFYPIVLDRLGNKGFPVLIATIMMLMGIWVHRANIKRITEGNENKFSFNVKSKKTKNKSDNDSDDNTEDKK